MERLTNLSILELEGNPSLGIPPEILKGYTKYEVAEAVPADPYSVLQYYFQSRRGPSRKLNEAKMLIVGQGDVGKTSLLKRLVFGTFDKGERKTEGINIQEWKILGRATTEGQAEPIRLNLWDFGGQEIMHATHQFFLTKRSLYLVVLDARKGENESNLPYWLKIIQSYGGDAPVIVVTNKSEPPHHLELNENRLAKDYAPNLQGFARVSCATGDGIPELRDAIIAQIHAMPHVHDRVPESYFKVKESLAKRKDEKKQDFLDYSQYEAICRRHGVTEKQDQTILIRFLHDLGNVLYFHDPDSPYHELRDTNILNPEWVTGGVYKIINSLELARNGGVLEKSRLAAILDDPECYPPERHDFLIGMMRKFELCFDFPDSNGQKLLIPELLNPNEPELGYDTNEALNFQYHYSVLPPGLISRFIVRMHHRLTRNPTYWRSGVVLDLKGNRALVRADTQAGRIYVSVLDSRPGRIRALESIRDAFDYIHRTIPRIGAEEKVPLPDNPAVVVDYQHLRKLEASGKTEIWPEGADRDYSIEELLNGIEEKSKRLYRIERERHMTRKPGPIDEDMPLPPPGPPIKALAWMLILVLIVFAAVVGVLAGAARIVPWYAIVPVLIAALLVIPTLISLSKWYLGGMEDKSLLSVLKESFRWLHLLKISRPNPEKVETKPPTPAKTGKR